MSGGEPTAAPMGSGVAPSDYASVDDNEMVNAPGRYGGGDAGSGTGSYGSQ